MRMRISSSGTIRSCVHTYPACVSRLWSTGPERSADASADAVSLTAAYVPKFSISFLQQARRPAPVRIATRTCDMVAVKGHDKWYVQLRTIRVSHMDVIDTGYPPVAAARGVQYYSWG